MSKSLRANRLLFLADAHLGAFSPKKNKELEESLIRLVDFCENQQYRIHILGDLFDYWMEYPDFHPSLASSLLQRFKKYHQSHEPTLFITGNHDNWTKDYLPSVGFDLEPDWRTYNSGSQKILLLHGDGLPDFSTQTIQRPLLHSFLRNPAFIRFYQTLLPPRLGLNLMKKFSHLSRSTETHRLGQQTLNRWAKKCLKENEIDAIICGHDHFPRKICYKGGTFTNTGAYYKDRTVVIYNNGSFDLVVWNDKLQELQPYKAFEQN